MTYFILPNDLVQIAFSGGRTSAYMLHRILDANGELNRSKVRVVFANTGREWPETLDFVAEVARRWSVEIDWIEYCPRERFQVVGHNSASRDGKPFSDLLEKKRFLPNQRFRFCTSDLKVKPAASFLGSLGWANWTTALGIRADEAHRSATQTADKWSNWRPLVESGITKSDVSDFWRRQPFDLRLPSIRGKTPLGNCDGCFLKSEAYLAAFARDYPERAAVWEADERRFISSAKGDAASYSKRFRREELRRSVERQGDWLFSDENYLCQADGGECL